MRKPRSVALITVVVLASVLGLDVPKQAVGWGGFAHYRASPAGLARQVNLPDICGDSYYWTLGLLGVGGEVKPVFAWGHGCQRTGVHTEYLIGVVPNSPTVYESPTAVELAGRDMYDLVTKMDQEHRDQEIEDLMVKTARGWVAHNMMDQVVHFTYFLGDSLHNWFEHRDKETWADHELFARATDYPTNAWGTYAHEMSAVGHPGIVNLAQKCFRKNGQTVDAVPGLSGTYETITVESREAISGLIGAQAADLSSKTYSLNNYALWQAHANAEGWSASTMVALHASSKSAAQAAVNGMP